MSSDEIGLESAVDIVLDDVDYVVADTHFQHKKAIEFGRNDAFENSWHGVSRMNARLIGNWNRKVDHDDTVVFLGDLVMGPDRYDQNVVDDYWNALNGDKHFIRGDHDHRRPTSVICWEYTAMIHHEERSYLAAHYPGDGMSHLAMGDEEYLCVLPEHHNSMTEGSQNLDGSSSPPLSVLARESGDVTVLDEFKEDFREKYPDNMYNERDRDTWIIHGHHHNCHPGVYPHINAHRRTINVGVEHTNYEPLHLDEITAELDKIEPVYGR